MKDVTIRVLLLSGVILMLGAIAVCGWNEQNKPLKRFKGETQSRNNVTDEWKTNFEVME